MIVDERFYKNVADYLPVPLPRPTPKKKLRDCDGKEIPIIHVLCEGIEW